MSTEVHIADRGAGKTQHCIDWMLEDPRHRAIVVASADRRQHILERLVKQTGIGPARTWDPQVLVFSGDLRGLAGREVIVDQADHLLQQLLRPHRLSGVTWDA